MKTRDKLDEKRKKLFSEHGHKSLKKYEHETLAEKESKPIKKAVKHPDKLGAGAAKRKALHNPKDKIAVVMKEFYRGTLNASSGKKVTNPKMAAAIGYSEARREGAHIPKKHKK